MTNKDYVVVAIALFLAVLLETTIVALPFVLYIVLCLFIIKPQASVAITALFAGVIVDALMLRPIGINSIFYLLVFFIILQYHRKFETATLTFIIFSATVAGFFYLLFFGSFMIILQTLLGTIIASGIYLLLNKILSRNVGKEKPYPEHLLIEGKG